MGVFVISFLRPSPPLTMMRSLSSVFVCLLLVTPLSLSSPVVHQECSDGVDETCVEVGAALQVEVPDEWTCRELCGFYGGVGYNCDHWFPQSHLCFCCND